MTSLPNNKSVQILQAAEEGTYGVPAVVTYNLEAILAVIRAAERKRSPAMILLFPWAMTYSGALLASLAHTACAAASVPVSLHLDHAQDGAVIERAATELPFDSIMVDMSHHEREENLARTQAFVELCHAHGKAVEAEPGRIEGGEDGVMDTGALEAVMTTRDEASRFVETGIDFLAPAFGNVHGEYGERGIVLEYERLRQVREEVRPKGVKLVLHGTNGFGVEEFGRCVREGVTKVNVNKVVMGGYAEVMREKGGRGPLTAVMEEGTERIRDSVEWVMDACGSSGKA
ncbi:MAG: hypothetical protein M1833_003181 [Piccolia ochrophora]|nr:MAG: hypothetical protein M1833_003181 [Piccolia ochrophora]